MTETEAQRQKEIQQAEELLFTGPQALGFVKGLFQGRFVSDWVMPYPRIPTAQQTELNRTLTELREFLDAKLDAVAIDRNADIPREVIDGLGRVGVLGTTAPAEYGGSGFTQMANCRILEEIGRRCASTSVFVNAHHSIGIRALLLFGTREQKQKWLPKLVTGEQLGAFALTEKEAGSDAANVQMTATPSADGSHFILNGEKRYITNAAIAHVLTVMARTPVPGKEGKTAITASLIDRGLEDYMLETAMLKVFTTERLWECINDAFQIYGGSAYFVDLPLERMLRDARINQIGEGSNEVLTSFIALVGMRGPGMEFKEIYDTMMKPNIQSIGRAFNSGMNRLSATVRTPGVPVRSAELRGFAGQLGRLIWRFNVAVNRALVVYRELVLDMQLLQERIAGAAMELFASTCTLSRWDAELQARGRNGEGRPPDFSAPDYFLRKSIRHAKQLLAELNDNDDKALLSSANAALGKREETEAKRP